MNEAIITETGVITALRQEVVSMRQMVEGIYAELKNNKDDRWLTTKEAANYIGQTEEWVRDNKLRLGVCINGKRLTFKKTFLENYMMLHFQIEKPSKRK